ncbi:hypothetical protein PWT90_04338 [Aphanocladium album]|nr:hypothetical protein PWT90_04338 [Aphanocladium album]
MSTPATPHHFSPLPWPLGAFRVQGASPPTQLCQKPIPLLLSLQLVTGTQPCSLAGWPAGPAPPSACSPGCLLAPIVAERLTLFTHQAAATPKDSGVAGAAKVYSTWSPFSSRHMNQMGALFRGPRPFHKLAKDSSYHRNSSSSSRIQP